MAAATNGALDPARVQLATVAMFACMLVPLFLSWLLVRLRAARRPPPFLKPDVYQALPLVDRKVVTHNTRRFRFALPRRDQRLGLPIGQHITFKAPGADGRDMFRPYTPVSDDDQLGYVDFVIKVYDAGNMSRHLDNLKIGDTLLMKGPKGRFQYERNSKRAIGMIAGGTGITPMYQVANLILKDPADKTQLSLIFANVTADDVLIKDELEAMAAKHPNRFKVFYVLEKPPAGWLGGVGFVSKEAISAHLPAAAPDVLVCRCGPLAMNRAMEAHLNALGYTKEMQFEF